jgi:hypothetical protein
MEQAKLQTVMRCALLINFDFPESIGVLDYRIECLKPKAIVTYLQQGVQVCKTDLEDLKLYFNGEKLP